MINILLIDDNDNDINLTKNKLGNECSIRVAKNTIEAIELLNTVSYFDFVLYSYGTGETSPQQKYKAFEAISHLCETYEIALILLEESLRGSKLPNQIVDKIKAKGGSLHSKSEIKESVNPNSLMSLLGIEYIQDKNTKDKERSLIVRKIEQEVVKFNVQVQQMKELFNENWNNIRQNISSSNTTLIKSNQRLGVLENKVEDIKNIVDNHRDNIEDRIESIEQILMDLKYQINNLSGNKSAFITTVGAIMAAIITGLISIIVIYLSKK